MPKRSAHAYGWWGERWLQYLVDEMCVIPLSGSQIRGAQRGDATLAFGRGKVTAAVDAGYSGRHTATLKVKPLGEREWKRVIEAIGRHPEAAHRLLSGTPGPELAAAFAEGGADLFPGQPAVRCTCWESWGCRHIRVLAVRGAELLDANPYLWLEVLGRSREQLLAAVRARLADQVGRSEADPFGASIAADRFLTTDADPDGIEVRAGATATPDALLRLLGPLPLPEEAALTTRLVEREVDSNGYTYLTTDVVQETADQVVARYLGEISHSAAQMATGEMPPRFLEEAIPGKRIQPKTRLAAEIAEALSGMDSPVRLLQLQEQCPTAAALPFHEAWPALMGALAGMEEFVTLAGRTVIARSALLAGLTLRHVITYPEWALQMLSPDADWVRVLQIAGCAAPYSIRAGGEICQVLTGQDDRLFARLRPEVGDELELTVVDPAQPLLAAALRRRGERTETGPQPADREAVTVLENALIDLPHQEATELQAVELLLAEGFYQGGRSPDPVWLLPSRAAGPGLHWGWGRKLTARPWGHYYPSFGNPPYVTWREQQALVDQFGAALRRSGLSRAEVEAALACVGAWCRYWRDDQITPRTAPEIREFAYFLWIKAPLEALRMPKMPAESFPRTLAAWFRFLEERNPRLDYRAHVEVCGQENAYLHRVRTLPAGRGAQEQLKAWELEGLRWLGPGLFFGR